MYCKNCGKELYEGAEHCDGCGVNQTISYPTNIVPDVSNKGLNILSFFIPIIGIILYFVKREEKPIEAKGTLKWALISIIVSTVLPFVIFLATLFISVLIQVLH